MAEIPNLAGKATDDLVEKIGGGKFQASYINWSRTVNLLREHAPGWLPELVANEHGSVIHRAPVGAYLLIRFRHADGTVTPEVPQAVMDNNNKAIPLDRIDARDITDTHRRGVCMAAAFTFGLAYELWAKMPLESGFADNPKPEPPPAVSDEEVEATRKALERAKDLGELEQIGASIAGKFDAATAQTLRELYSIRRAELTPKAA